MSCECGISGVPVLWTQPRTGTATPLSSLSAPGERECEAAENIERSFSKTCAGQLALYVRINTGLMLFLVAKAKAAYFYLQHLQPSQVGCGGWRRNRRLLGASGGRTAVGGCKWEVPNLRGDYGSGIGNETSFLVSESTARA